METKKISFGFSKISKKTEILSKAPKPEKKVELIDCLEDQSIRVRDAVEESHAPLIIPIQGPSNKIIETIKKAREKHIKDEKQQDDVPDSALSLDELAARELIREAQNRDTVKNETKVFSLPLKEEKFVAEGAVESSMEDYESVPISDYGMAMLRGMNWKEGMPIGKRTKKTEPFKLPELRPKGLGLGANKMVNSSKPTQAVDKNGKELQLVKGAFCKIIAGNHRGHYCDVQGFDDENCRVIVKTALTNEILTLNEFLVVPVSKEDYEKNCRVINTAKYDDYKEKSRQISRRSRSRSRTRSRERSSSRSHKKDKKKLKKHSDEDSRKHKKKSKSKNKSSDSDSDREYRRRNKNKR